MENLEYIVMGAMIVIIAGYHFPEIKNLGNKNIKIDNINGIDLESLAICRTLGYL